MGAHIVIGLLALLQVGATNQVQPSESVPPKAATPVVVTAPARCDARPYQRLVGRTVSDLLTARLPPNTRIYRLDDPVSEPIQSGRLSVELNRSTRVRRVYCS